jgi:hypothetical protein
MKELLALDKKGYPVLKLGAVPTVSGNPYHDAFSGQFTFTPPGVNVVIGKKILKGLSSSTRRILFDAAKKVKANQMSAVVKDGKVEFILYRDGRLLHSFSVADDSESGKAAADSNSNPVGGLGAPTGAFRDAVVDAARETSLEGDQLKAFFEKKLNMKVEGEQLAHLEKLVDEQRVNDLTDYLNSYLSGDKQTNKLRISGPRGFVRKSFASLETPVINQILDRLKLRGWSDDVIRDKIISGFSKERRKEFLPNSGETKATKDKQKAAADKKVVDSKKRRGQDK